ncbi:sensor histidine kinase TodS [Gottschalkia purinilytica]|uniref:histidine kinase n=1 Tax=Gottschalkia purinilytica TaxID=1503 RepID=A0A0L0WDL4_GOTPU|nr:ATP-binding protein [Gottschalkia purinilytica]KNF09568.1 sensor histidine kinase TodS [Gottschalkia purinilytica]
MSNVFTKSILNKVNTNINYKKSKTYYLILLFIILFSIYLSKINFTSFHMMIETITGFVGVMMFVISLSTFNVKDESPFINFIGTFYGFVSIFNLMSGIKLYKSDLVYKEIVDIHVPISIISGCIKGLVILAFILFVEKYKDNESQLFNFKNLSLVSKIYLIIFGLFTMDIFIWETIPRFFIRNKEILLLKILNQYGILIIFSISLLVLHQKKDRFNKRNFTYLKLSIISQILGEISLILGRLSMLPYNQDNLLSLTMTHIFRFISIMFIYKILLYENIIEPYKHLNAEIVQRKKAQLDLGKKTNILNSILESTNNGIIVLNLRREVIHFNKSFIDMFDIKGSVPSVIKEEKMLEFINTKFVYPDDVIERIEDIYNFKVEINNTIQLKNGKTIEVVLTPFVLDGEKSGCIFSFRDITQSKMFERELEKSTELYRKLLELLPDAVYVQKREHIIITNKKGLELSQKENIYKLSEIPYEDVFKISYEHRKTVKERIAKLLTEETSVEFLEQQIILDKNISIDVEVAASSFKHEDDHYIVTVIRDISERRKAEKLEEQVEIKEKLLKEIQEYDNLKTQFFTTISHELKTPLNVILGAVQLLESTKEDIMISNNIETVNKYLKMMKQNCYRLLRLIRNLIDITKADTGFLIMNTQNCNIVNIVEEVTLSVADFIKSKGINLVFDTEIEEKVIACDIEKVERILLNLLSNAIKFTEENGEINVNIYDKEDFIVISVKDTGIGIQDDMKDKIFDRFRQVDTSLTRKTEGSGIGLSIVKSMIELHGGNIKVESEFGKGSEFIIELPVKTMTDNTSEEVDHVTDKNVEMINVEFSDIYF